MRLFGILFTICIISLFIVVMRVEIMRSGRAIGKLQSEVAIKQARNQYLELENARLSSPQIVEKAAQEKLNLRLTPPQDIIVLED